MLLYFSSCVSPSADCMLAPQATRTSTTHPLLLGLKVCTLSDVAQASNQL
jgi:hypothetical protein